MSTSVSLAGTVDKVIYKSESGFAVFAFVTSEKQVVTVTAEVPDLTPGAYLTMQGEWVFHAKFGRQFKATECHRELPTDAEGIRKYLGSGLIKGIGPKFADRVVAKFGAKTLEVIDKNPNILLTIEGVGAKRLESIIAAWQDQKAIARVMVFLQGKGVSTTFASKIYKRYGNNSIEVIEQNPYRLVEDIWGVGFKTADEVALKLGFDRFSTMRVKAGIIHAITESVNNGSLYAELDDLKVLVKELLEFDDTANDLIKKGLHELFGRDQIKLVSHEGKHFVTIPQYYWAEKGIANKINKLKAASEVDHHFNLDEVYQSLRAENGQISLHENQQHGIMTALQHKITVITGGPGTGKTTLVKKLISILEEHRARYRLAAPTGRAAKRMFEGTGRSAETLHRLLEFNPQIMGFSRNETNALSLDFLIVDEASMIDVFLMNSLLKAMPDRSHLILLGDIDQLPSVGAGDILHDLIDSGAVPVVRLTHIFRQAQDSLIIVNAHKVNNGEFPVSFLEGAKRDFKFIKMDQPEELFPVLRELYTSTLKKAGIDIKDTVTLVPMNRGIAGTHRLNQELQTILNPQDNNQVIRGAIIFKCGDRVMQITNNYDKFVFNGDMGEITLIDHENRTMDIVFGERVVAYDFDELNELVLSYAISIHKSQGSEFSAVIIPVFMSHFILLQRNLIYTAITRAKKMCILVGQPRAIAMAIKNNKGSERKTFLKEFLTTTLEAR